MNNSSSNAKKDSNFIFETDGVLLNMMEGNSSYLGYYPRRKRPLNTDYHSHSQFEIFYVTDGTLLVHFEDETVRAGAGTVLFVSPETNHYTELDREQGASRYTIHFVFKEKKKTRTASTLSDFLSFPKYLKIEIDDFIRAQLELFIRALSQGEETMAGCQFLSFLLGASKALGKENAVEAPIFNDTEANRLYKIERLCSLLYAEKLSLSFLADELHLSERQVERIIKKHYGIGFHALITSYRMKEAQMLLSEGLSVSVVADSVGYGSSSAFHRAFRKAFGISPNKYAKNKLP